MDNLKKRGVDPPSCGAAWSPSGHFCAQEPIARIKMLGKDAEVSSHFSVGLHKGSEDSGSAGMASAGPETKKANFVQS